MLKINCLYVKPAARLLLLVVFSSCVKGTFAQSPFKADLEEVKVYSTRVDQLTNETGRDITIISHNEIRQLPVDSPEELLRYLPGMVVQSRNGFGVQSDISMRGSTFSQVLVLIDGMRLNDPLTAHFNGYLPVSLSEIDRIEIIRGPATAMYGSDAVGGVINIITKTFSGNNDQPSVADGRLSYGQHNLISGDAGGFLNGKKLKLGGGLMVNQSDGQVLPSGENADFNLKTASLSGTYQFSRHWKASLRSAYDYRNFNAQYFYTRSPYDESREQVNTWWNQLQVSHAGRLSSTNFSLAYKATRDSFLFNPAFTASVHQTKFINGQLNHTINFKQNLKLGLGAQTDLRTIESNDRGDHQDKHIGTYAVLFFKPAASVNLTGSLRGDYDDNFGFELLPQVSGSWELKKWTIRASVGRSIRGADFTERYVSNNLPGPLPELRNVGNPNLKAETAWSYEAGTDYQPADWFTAKLTFFRRNAQNMIDYVITNESQIPNNANLTQGADYFYAQNIYKLNTEGAELAMIANKNLGLALSLSGMLGYSYFYSFNGQDIISKYIANHPKHLVTANLLLSSDRFRMGINGLWKERTPDEDQASGFVLQKKYSVWNTSLDVNVYKQKLWAGIQINNLFDTQYSDIMGASMPGRWIMAGIKWRFVR